jgi:hypothetical protein
MTLANKIKQAIGFLTLRVGIKQLKEILWDIPKTQIQVLPILAGVKLYGTELDMTYNTTDWDNWSEILDKVYSILGENTWTAEVADCDNRAEFTSALISIIYHLNTCARVYCEVKNTTSNGTYLHWCNLVIDKDKNIYLVDMDNGGLKQKITSPNVVMGNCSYKLISYRIG